VYVTYFQGKLSYQGKLYTELYKEEDKFNVMIKEISKPTYLEVTDVILKFKHQKNTRDTWKNGRDFTESGPSFMEENIRFN
jgi:hypothetical protein